MDSQGQSLEHSFHLLNLCRWSIACSPRETIYLQTWIRSSSTAYMDDFFYGSALSLGEHLKIDASLLRLGRCHDIHNILCSIYLQ